MSQEDFRGHIDHVAGVTLQTLSIEKSTLPDKSKHEIEIKEGTIAVWKVKFLKDKGVWKLAETQRREI